MPAFNISQLDTSAISKNEVFVLDTNVLFFLHSGFYTSNSLKVKEYSKFIAKLLSRGNQVCITTIALQEFLHVFERKSYELYLMKNGKSDNRSNPSFLSLKQYRALPAERSAIKKNIERIMLQLKTYQIYPCSVLERDITSMIQCYDQNLYDPMDYIMVSECKKNGIYNFITDDKDFKHDCSVNVYHC